MVYDYPDFKKWREIKFKDFVKLQRGFDLPKQDRREGVLDWKRKEETRADVKITIRDMLYDELPEPTYTEPDCEDRTQKVYLHIYDNYVDEKVNVYAQ